MADAKKSSIQKKSGCYLLNIKQPDRTAKRIKASFQRMSVSINTLKSERTVSAAVGLIDLSERGAGFFTSELLAKGCVVEVMITEPVVLKIRALVAWSIPIETGLQECRFPCRSGLQFIYDNEQQRQSVCDFLEKIVANPIDNYRRAVSAPVTGVAPGPADAATGEIAAPVAEAPVTSAAEVTPVPPLAEAPAADASFSTPTDAAPAAAGETPAKPEGEDGGGQSKAA
jgi:hypothetical protein